MNSLPNKLKFSDVLFLIPKFLKKKKLKNMGFGGLTKNRQLLLKISLFQLFLAYTYSRLHHKSRDDVSVMKKKGSE